MEQPAFPFVKPEMAQRPDIYAVFRGMSIRDYFAAQALQGILACSFASTDFTMADYAETSYLLADAMMRERDRS